MDFKRREGVRGTRVKNVQKKSWRVRPRLMGERSRRLNSVRSQMCGQGGVAGGATTTFRRCCVGSTGRQAVAARYGEWSTGSSKSSGEEARRNKGWEAENKELRARIEALEKKGGEGAQGGQGHSSSRKKLDEQKRKLQKESRDIEMFSFVSGKPQE